MAEKDILEKTLESYDDVFADIVNVLLFDGQEEVKPDDLKQALTNSYYHADGKIREQERDVAKYWNKVLLHMALFGMENMTEAEGAMPIRVISYDGADYRNHIRYEKYKKGKKEMRRRVVDRYPVITIVLHFGKTRWNSPKTLLECLDVPEKLKPYVSDYRINVFDIAWLTDEQVSKFKSDFRVVAEYFVQTRKNEKYHPSKQELEHIEDVLHLLSVLGGESRYEEMFTRMVEVEKVKEVKTMSEVLDRMLDKKYNEGRRDAEKMLDHMLDEKYNEGKRDGEKLANHMLSEKFDDGKKEGERKGKKVGQITTLAKLVQDKLLTVAQAAASAGLSVLDFSSEAATYGYQV